MVVRKKAETIHLRVSATSKACLEGLAIATGKTSTRVLEDLIVEAAAKCRVEGVDVAVDDRFWSGEDWTLLKALELAHSTGDAVLGKLRTYFLADEALSRKDRFLIEAILWSPDIFLGDTPIFTEAEGVITNQDSHRVFNVDLYSINQNMSRLEEYADFRVKNREISLGYLDYIRMVEAKLKGQ